ncbi:MAG: energy transducer TonB, partial [Bacteroidetes bacterium]
PQDFADKPTYPGGLEAMRAFIRKHLKYPEAAQAAGVEGTVRLRMTINHQGKVIRTKVITSVGYGCDEEAERVARLLQFTAPRKARLRARFNKTVNFHFKYQDPAPKSTTASSSPQSTQLRYTIKGKAPEPGEEGKKGYNYTIKLK